MKDDERVRPVVAEQPGRGRPGVALGAGVPVLLTVVDGEIVFGG